MLSLLLFTDLVELSSELSDGSGLAKVVPCIGAERFEKIERCAVLTFFLEYSVLLFGGVEKPLLDESLFEQYSIRNEESGIVVFLKTEHFKKEIRGKQVNYLVSC